MWAVGDYMEVYSGLSYGGSEEVYMMQKQEQNTAAKSIPLLGLDLSSIPSCLPSKDVCGDSSKDV